MTEGINNSNNVEQMRVVDFGYNWNHKLNCRMFTTLRLKDRFVPGEIHEIRLKGKVKGNAVVVEVRPLMLHQINAFIAGIDTGYNRNECHAILKKMYKAKNLNWNTQIIQFVLFQYIDANGQGEPELDFSGNDSE
ncbi:MAG: hypothetical protein JKY80_07020 [Mariprofundaceae bacterium]|nr:hypothetical protein [Mariprofundaceae bacterium]